MATASPPEIHFGRALKGERIDAKLSQEELARAIGMEPSEISVLEAGVRSPQLRTMRRVADGLGVPLSQVFERAEQFEAEVGFFSEDGRSCQARATPASP